MALTLDENGIPPTADGRLALAKKIIDRGAEYGLTKDDFVIDVLCLATSADPSSASVILESLRRIRAELGVRTVLGVSNISFGLPARPQLNATFYALALGAGLTSAIVNPLSPEMMSAYRSWRALMAHDPGCAAWIAANAEGQGPGIRTLDGRPQTLDLKSEIIHGLKADAAAAARDALAAGKQPVEIIDGEIVPALETVGKGFETGKLFLPQLLMAAEAAAQAFDVIRAALEKSGQSAEKKGPIVLATVKGDIHDIGKNIVKTVLENYGYEVIDLGRDVPPETILQTVEAEHIRLVGLSALMTTTLPAMEETIHLLQTLPEPPAIMVGGAVVTPEYARQMGADYYSKDARQSVEIAREVLG